MVFQFGPAVHTRANVSTWNEKYFPRIGQASNANLGVMKSKYSIGTPFPDYIPTEFLYVKRGHVFAKNTDGKEPRNGAQKKCSKSIGPQLHLVGRLYFCDKQNYSQ